jgi:hypothetical protein
MTKPVFSDLLQKLEAERNDLSYKTPPKVRVDTVFVKEKVYITSKKRDQRDKLMFHAGRFSAGARDATAVAANEWLESL